MSSIGKLLPFVRPYWKSALLSLVLLTAVAMMDLAIPRLIQRIIDQGITANDPGVVLKTSLLMLLLSASSAAAAVGNNNASIRVGEGTARDLREAQFIKIQSFSHSNLDDFTTGRLMVRLTSDTTAVQRLVQVSLRIGTRAPMMMVGSLILMVNTSPNLALSLAPLLLVTGIMIVVYSTKMEPMFRLMQSRLDRLNTVLQENISGARLVKAFVRADFEAGRFEAANLNYTDHTTRVMQVMSTMGPVLTIFVNIGVVIVIWAGGIRAIQGDLTLGQVVAFINYLISTMTPLIMMTMLSNTWANGLASHQRIREVLETEPAVQEDPQPYRLPAETPGKIVFEGVYFSYTHPVGPDTAWVLEDINLTIEPGQTVAFLGATGVGKTTLALLISRAYDASLGRVLIDGVDVRQLQKESLLAHIGIVPQETILFSGSVRENIRYGRPQAGEDEVIEAAKAAQAHDFILKLPGGYDTHVEERGVNLSGGQKQRLAIARALLMRPTVLILDDSTSSVDVETEALIHAALEEGHQGKTTVLVAQRISTVLTADRIVILEDGRIAAQGTHVELLASSPVYQEIYESQLGGEA